MIEPGPILAVIARLQAQVLHLEQFEAEATFLREQLADRDERIRALTDGPGCPGAA